MSDRVFTAIFAEPEGWIVGFCKELPGAIVQERTLDGARNSIKEVIRELLDVNFTVHVKTAKVRLN